MLNAEFDEGPNEKMGLLLSANDAKDAEEDAEENAKPPLPFLDDDGDANDFFSYAVP